MIARYKQSFKFESRSVVSRKGKVIKLGETIVFHGHQFYFFCYLGTARKPFLKSATVDYTPGSVSIPLSVVTETTRLNPPRSLHAENSHL